jgi:hypothetical protein
VRRCDTLVTRGASDSESSRKKRSDLHLCSALGGTRTPNLLIRSQMLYPLSYERWNTAADLRFYSTPSLLVSEQSL